MKDEDKCFIKLKNGTYKEITHKELQKRRKRYVTYKDKHNLNFNTLIEKRINNVFQIKTRIQNSDFEKYARQLEKLHSRKVDISKQNKTSN